MELSAKGIQELCYWGSVVLKGLEDQHRLIGRARSQVDKLKPEQLVSHRQSAHQKIGRALYERSVEPLRELKTIEKGVVAKDIEDAFVGATNQAQESLVSGIIASK